MEPKTAQLLSSRLSLAIADAVFERYYGLPFDAAMAQSNNAVARGEHASMCTRYGKIVDKVLAEFEDNANTASYTLRAEILPPVAIEVRGVLLNWQHVIGVEKPVGGPIGISVYTTSHDWVIDFATKEERDAEYARIRTFLMYPLRTMIPSKVREPKE